MDAYYEMDNESDLIARGDLLLFRKRLLGQDERTSFIRRRDAMASWPIVFRQYLYVRPPERRSCQILFFFLKVFSVSPNYFRAGGPHSETFFKPCVYCCKFQLLGEVGK